MDYTLWEILQMGGMAMWVILGSSVLAVAVGLERLLANWRFLDNARTLADTVFRCLQKGSIADARSACERSNSPMAEVFLVGYEKHGRVKPELVATAVHRERVRVLMRLKNWLWILGTIGAVAPFIGLFGTVLGILHGFGEIHTSGKNDFKFIAGPLSEALYATAFGILVAVEAVIIYNYFNQRGSRIGTEVKLITDEFLEYLENSPVSAGSEGGDRGDRKAA